MTQQEFENIYSSIKADLLALARMFCRSTSVDLDAEDIVQEALVAFWELSRKDYPMPNPKGLLVLITKNICISRYRKKKLVTMPIEGDDYQGGESLYDAVDRMDEKIIRQRLYETLTRTERLYMQLKSEEGLSLDEIEKKTGRSRPSIKTGISKARKKMQEQLKKMGYGK